MYVSDDSENDRLIKEEVVADSGAVECVTSRKRVSQLKVEETPKSRRGERHGHMQEEEKSRRKVK